jgi:teichoic acid transport system permease protein
MARLAILQAVPHSPEAARLRSPRSLRQTRRAAGPHPELIRLDVKAPLAAYVRAVWERRQFASMVAMAQLRAQNMDTVLGGVWHLLNPLLLVGVYFLIFGVILDVGERGTDNFVAFLSCGIFVFFYTRKCLQQGARTVVTNLPLIRSIKFPRVILPLSAVLTETIALVPAVAVMLLVALLTGERPMLAWVLLLPIFALQMVFNFGAAAAMARLTDHFHDVQQVLPFVMQVWFYFSGVLYSVDAFVTDPVAAAVMKADPAYVYITLVRDAVLHGETSPALWTGAVAWALVVGAGGFVFFRAREERYGSG